MNRSTTWAAPEVAVEHRGAVSRDSADHARSTIAAVFGHAPEPVLFARVRLTMAAGPAMARPAVAQANLDVNGRLVRAQVAGATMREAIDLLHDRLLVRLDRVGRHWEARRGGRPTAGPHEWRHGAEPTHRPDHYPRPVEEREVIRHKSFTLAAESPDEAAFDMETLDYGFLLFTDAETGQDSVIYHSGEGYRLAQVAPRPRREGTSAVPLTVSPHPPPRMGVREAIDRLETTGLPFVFFLDARTGRGNVLYHRYDGHYGLITPA
ncbi:sigma 54 modulation/S30EA ribosomal C-terminal domain-containing protein [Nocardiopsis sp. EMB25]|uniref:sigma 54 modulation/S30EA ribosomal C-terminal domain-containing protein n=1 Tax=Nocardiopsis sp. EMB25 TaxID=2835867 RepID=UPI00228506C5|nr:sigma 54 modulation/S30EA ribosomal C-terminal domain-containing protein [Nocardiopsis sp. EMB25]MCY9784368.1 sigma 54 modulation/S30EA ribosomal C-terminal domain-containing protein [Nocardiopsis sp. EMB25]